jgi:hypothetical protein
LRRGFDTTRRFRGGRDVVHQRLGDAEEEQPDPNPAPNSIANHDDVAELGLPGATEPVAAVLGLAQVDAGDLTAERNPAAHVEKALEPILFGARELLDANEAISAADHHEQRHDDDCLERMWAAKGSVRRPTDDHSRNERQHHPSPAFAALNDQLI